MPITHCKIDFELLEKENSVKVISTVKISGKTGVEMETLHSVSVNLLTIYDMCKAVGKNMEISNIRLEKNRAARVEIFCDKSLFTKKYLQKIKMANIIVKKSR